MAVVLDVPVVGFFRSLDWLMMYRIMNKLIPILSSATRSSLPIKQQQNTFTELTMLGGDHSTANHPTTNAVLFLFQYDGDNTAVMMTTTSLASSQLSSHHCRPCHEDDAILHPIH